MNKHTKLYEDYVVFVESKSLRGRSKEEYLRQVRKLAEYYPSRSLKQLTERQVFDYLISRRDEQKLRPSTLNQAVMGLRMSYLIDQLSDSSRLSIECDRLRRTISMPSHTPLAPQTLSQRFIPLARSEKQITSFGPARLFLHGGLVQHSVSFRAPPERNFRVRRCGKWFWCDLLSIHDSYCTAKNMEKQTATITCDRCGYRTEIRDRGIQLGGRSEWR